MQFVYLSQQNKQIDEAARRRRTADMDDIVSAVVLLLCLLSDCSRPHRIRTAVLDVSACNVFLVVVAVFSALIFLFRGGTVAGFVLKVSVFLSFCSI